MATHLEAISLQLVEVIKRIDHLDECLDNTKRELREQLMSHVAIVNSMLESARTAMLAEVKAVDAKVDFPLWAIRLIVGAIVLACLSAVGMTILKIGQERAIPAPVLKGPSR